MADHCEHFKDCEDLPVQTYIWRTIEGPPVAVADGTVPFTEDQAITGLSTQLFLRLLYRAEAKLGDVCVGPVRSVLGLGPMEKFTYATMHSREVDLGALLRKTTEKTNTVENTIRDATETVDSDTTTSSSGSSDSSGFSLGPLGDFDFSGENSASATEHVVSNTTTNLFDVLTSTVTTTSESQTSELTAGLTDITAQSTTRTLINPYFDRSMMVRFFPVYREVLLTLKLDKATPGISVAKGKLATVPTLATHGEFLTRAVRDKTLLNLAVADLASITAAATGKTPVKTPQRGAAAPTVTRLDAHVRSQIGYYTAAYIHDVNRARGPEPVLKLVDSTLKLSRLYKSGASLAGFDKERLTVDGDRVLLPAKSGKNLAATVNLPREQQEAVELIDDPNFINKLRLANTKTIKLHLFMGTHVEVTPGDCILKDAPPPTTAE